MPKGNPCPGSKIRSGGKGKGHDACFQGEI